MSRGLVTRGHTADLGERGKKPTANDFRGPRRSGTGLACLRDVTVRITVAEDKVRRVRVEGRLSAVEVGELEHAVGDDLRAVCLELSNLRSADAAALSALRRLWQAGVEMRGASPHLAWQIEEDEP